MGLMRSFLPELVMGDHHSHVVFSTSQRRDWAAEEKCFRAWNIAGISMVSLPPWGVDDWERDMECFHSMEFSHLKGIGLEGPGLDLPGGTPSDSAWHPTRRKWRRLLAAGPCYVVCSAPSDEEVELFAEYGCSLCLGHLNNTRADAEHLYASVRLARQLGVFVLVDHFLNDMSPKDLVYHERSGPRGDEIQRSADRLRRAGVENGDDVLGPVPAMLLRLAQAGEISLMLNCDGGHVAYPIVRALFDLIGAPWFLAMTDFLPGGQLGSLRAKLDKGLYWNGATVAGSSHTLRAGRSSMEQSGLFSPRELDEFFRWRKLPGCKQ